MGALDTMVKRVVKNIDLRKKLNDATDTREEQKKGRRKVLWLLQNGMEL